MNTLSNSGSRIISAILTDGGYLEVVRFTPSGMAYCTGATCPGTVVKEIYAGYEIGGRVYLKETITGVHTPQSILPEKFEFPEDGK